MVSVHVSMKHIEICALKGKQIQSALKFHDIILKKKVLQQT